VTLPASIRMQRGWEAGTRLIVIETSAGVLLRQTSPFPATRPEDVFGSARYDGPPLSLKDMDAAIDAEASRRAQGHGYRGTCITRRLSN